MRPPPFRRTGYVTPVSVMKLCTDTELPFQQSMAKTRKGLSR